MRSALLRCFVLIALFAAPATRADSGPEPLRPYFGIGTHILLRAPEAGASDGAAGIALFDAESRRELARALPIRDAEGRVDLTAMFPAYLNVSRGPVLYAQWIRDTQPVGAPIVIEPMITPRVANDAWTEAVMTAFEQNDAGALERLRALSKEQIETLAGQVVWNDPPARACAGYRVYADRLVELETSLGVMTIALRPDAAPNTCFNFLHLVEGGFYEGVPFHRIVPTDRLGRPFVVQAGDPGGTGDGTPGFSTDFEPSELPHDFGVVSMARELDDPNSNGSQFFICLSREGCARLDGRFVAFGEVVEGVDVLDAIAAVPVGARDPADPASAIDRPLDPPVIVAARTRPAPPITERPARIQRQEAAGVER